MTEIRKLALSATDFQVTFDDTQRILEPTGFCVPFDSLPRSTYGVRAKVVHDHENRRLIGVNHQSRFGERAHISSPVEWE
ncbi:hypothetical protein V525_17450 [Gordonia alkanivorans CGMCC 6845]|uniref:Uncharacterized protein n=1 Tax=Gordonia alkanivorans CGMCC 6845 TaxID=1423140 RepID=W9DH53_9ACTN|nr:hypothetical protein V525_17450 [Gordonia alkanivorans CGMCC 6845]